MTRNAGVRDRMSPWHASTTSSDAVGRPPQQPLRHCPQPPAHPSHHAQRPRSQFSAQNTNSSTFSSMIRGGPRRRSVGRRRGGHRRRRVGSRRRPKCRNDGRRGVAGGLLLYLWFRIGLFGVRVIWSFL
ncbi:Os10g0454000 [Oryza sativa Japonica Group]|uniref:Os10g0454000 protein n=1 Tax=Oryza sativa subsp. japonica TaxID=39947 RepID=Q0IXA9_ORYSJ|nr:Os10g0454000 [Oryza sativa Japonica Group]|eukprot:NP_001064742.1 Os10g0454000 [Oryza sativa Japonica Group]